MRMLRTTLAALLLPLAAEAQERQVLTGPAITIWNLAGEVRLERGTGNDDDVEVTRGGLDRGGRRGGRHAVRRACGERAASVRATGTQGRLVVDAGSGIEARDVVAGRFSVEVGSGTFSAEGLATADP